MFPYRGVFGLFGSFLLQLTLGTIATFGNMSPYITSYFHIHEEKQDVTVYDIVWVLALNGMGQGLFVLVGGFIDNKIGPRVTTYIGSFIASFGVAVSYFTINSTVITLALTYGLCFGIGIGIAYGPPLTAGMMYFPDNKGLVSGIIVSGFGLGSFIFSQVQTWYINPDNRVPNDDGYFVDRAMLEKIPNVFLLLGGIYSLFQLVGCSLLTQPSVNNKSSDNNEEVQKPNIPSNENQELCDSLSPKQILQFRQFYNLWITYLLNNQVVFFINTMYKAYGQIFIHDDKFLALVGAIGSIFNSGGRIVWGIVLDKSTYKICMLTLTAGICVLMATFSFTPYGGKIMFMIWVLLLYFFCSGNYVLFPTCTLQTFGVKYSAINYGLVYSNMIVGSLLAAILTQNLWTYLGWTGLQCLVASFSALSFIITLLFNNIKLNI